MAFNEIIKIGPLALKNRVVMCSLTRQRASLEGVPGQLVQKYYAQRAGAGLILTEALPVSSTCNAFPGAGCLYNRAHALAWRKVTEAVQKRGGAIFAQLIHCGRNGSPNAIGHPTVAPSAIAPRGNIYGKQPYTVPKQLTVDEISRIKEDFLNSFKMAKIAGFDGITLHGANGYLIDSFIRSFTNQRKDSYGGSPQNRCRFALELVDLALNEWQSPRVSIKLSPVGRYGDMFDENPEETYSYLIKELDKRKIGSIELVRAEGEFMKTDKILPKEQMPDVLKTLGKHFSGIVIGNGGYNGNSALQDIEHSKADMISFGRYYIANPDLAQRLINKWPLATNWDLKTFYTGGAKGYTDFPFSPMNKHPYREG